MPIHEVRKRITAPLGETAARHDVLDEVILDLWREHHSLGLEGISDLSSATEQQLNDSIQGMNTTLFYLRCPVSSPLIPNPFGDDRLTGADIFNPELDVASVHEQASTTLEQAIARVTKLKQPDGKAKVFVLRIDTRCRQNARRRPSLPWTTTPASMIRCMRR